MKTIMVIDDERDIRDSLEGVFSDEGYRVVSAEDADKGLQMIRASLPDIVLLDIWMPGIDGVELLKMIKAEFQELPVIMISGHATIETAVKTTKLGAYDFIEKPLSLDKIVLTVEHALEKKRLMEENIALRESFSEDFSLVGETPAIKKLGEDIRRVAPTSSWVLITGENGTGKEIVARNVYIYSERADKAFVEVNCAAIPEELIESELFGHEKGAFTNALRAKKGKFDMADLGTIFLDEIGDMSLRTQAKILRILQEQSFERVGGNENIRVDVRVIAATNKNLVEEIKKGAFREDLYYRLNVIPFHVPSLRDRRDDIPLFVDHFLDLFSRKSAKERGHLTKDALKAFMDYLWPGNVRELKNLIERLVIMSPSNEIGINDLPDYMSGGASSSKSSGGFMKGTLREARGEFERSFIKEKLKEFGGNVTKTAEAIGIERSHLYRKIKDYGIET